MLRRHPAPRAADDAAGRPTSTILFALLAAVVLATPTGVAAELRAGPSLDQAQSTTPQFASLRDGEARHATLERLVRLDLDDVPLTDALDEAAARGGVRIAYATDVVPADARVTLRAERIAFGDALMRLLAGTDLDLLLLSSESFVVVRRDEPAAPDANVQVQTGMVRGLVTDSETQQPLASVQVLVEGTGRGGFTNRDGRYFVTQVPAGSHRVTASSIGHRTSTIDVDIASGDTVTVDFVLDIAPTTLSELVVTVTGEQRRVELGHVVGQIDADSVVREAPINSLTDLISGRSAGVQVLHQSGLTGSTPRIRIRGVNSTAMSNDPILVVDGVRVDNSTGPSIGTGLALRGGRLNDLNPEEIESIEIAKGPSAATLYGTDAANGVIVVTTKRGRAGPAVWRMWTDHAWANSAVDAFPENWIGWGQTATDPTPRRCTLFDVASNVCTTVDSVGSFNPLNESETSPFTTGHRQAYGVQVSGGSDQLTYLFSGELSDEDGYVRMPPAEAERFESIHGPSTLTSEFLRPNTERGVSLRANVTTTIDDRASVSARASYVRNNSLFVADGPSSVIAGAVRGPGYRDDENGYGGGAHTPAVRLATTREEKVDRFVTSLSGQWAPLSWLDARATFGLDHASSDREGLSRTGVGEVDSGIYDQVLLRATTYSGDLGLTGTAPLTSRLMSATSVGVQYNRRDETQLFARALGLAPGASGPAGATSTSVVSVDDEAYVLGGYVQQQLSLNGRLFLIGAIRGDGGSAFGEDVSLAAYPKASLSWMLSEEPFMPRWNSLTSLRLRAAWGASGVQPRRADVIPSFAYTTGIVDGSVVPSAQLDLIGNPDLEPERQRELEFGLDVELFGSRVNLEGTYYNRVSKDALIRVQVLPSHGGFSRLENLGSVRNRGVEGALRVELVDTRSLRWNVSLLASRNRNRLLELAPGMTELAAASRHRHAPDFPLWGLWEREFTYDDADANGLITADEITVSDTAVFKGSSVPTRDVTLASTLTLFDGRLRFGAQLDHRGGHVRLDNDEVSRCSALVRACRGLNDPSASLDEQARAVATTLGAQAVVPIHDASFVRLREVSVSYIADDLVSPILRGRQFRVTLGARNLALWTDFPGADPEGSTPLFAQGDPISVDAFANNGAFPQARSWTLRVDVGN